MSFNDIFYFHAHYGGDINGEFQEFDEYGFIAARDFSEAMSLISDNYRDDLISVTIECIGDTGIISTSNKDHADSFKASYLCTHYGDL